MPTPNIYKVIGLDSKLSALNKKLDKKMFYDYADLNKKEKNIITKYIDRIELTYLLTPTTINIQPFINDETHYEGVMFITVNLREKITDKQINVIEEIIHGALPNPVMIVFQLDNTLKVSTCMKRLNKVDKSSVVQSDIHRSAWLNLENKAVIQEDFLNAIHVNNLSFSNFYAFYKDIDLAVEALENAETIGDYHIEKDQQKHEKQQQTIKEIKNLEAEITKIKAAIKKESQFNKKVEMNVKVQQLTKQINQLKQELSK